MLIEIILPIITIIIAINNLVLRKQLNDIKKQSK